MILRKTEIVTKEIAVDQGPDHVPRKVGIKTEIDLETDPETDLEKGRKGRDHERERSLGPDLVRNIRKVTKETDTAEIGPDLDPKTDTGTGEMIDTETETMLMSLESSRRSHLDTRSIAEDLEVVPVKT